METINVFCIPSIPDIYVRTSDERANNELKKARNECMREGPTFQCHNLCIEIDKDSNDPKDLIIGASG
jgi:hypothetical protein